MINSNLKPIMLVQKYAALINILLYFKHGFAGWLRTVMLPYEMESKSYITFSSIGNK